MSCSYFVLSVPRRSQKVLTLDEKMKVLGTSVKEGKGFLKSPTILGSMKPVIRNERNICAAAVAACSSTAKVLKVSGDVNNLKMEKLGALSSKRERVQVFKGTV